MDCYVAVDWAFANMAIARMTEKSNDIKVIDVPSSIKELQVYLENLKGTICLTIKETSTSHWGAEIPYCISCFQKLVLIGLTFLVLPA